MLNLMLQFHPAPLAPLVSALFVLMVVGLVCWLVVTYVPMIQPIKTVFIVIVVLALCWWLLRSFGLM